MGDWLASIPFGDVSWVAIVAGAVIAVLRGDIVPRRTYEAIVKERDQWRDIALRNADSANKALAGLEVTKSVVEALPPAHDERTRP